MSVACLSWLLGMLGSEHQRDVRQALLVVSRLDPTRVTGHVRRALSGFSSTRLASMLLSSIRLYLAICLRLSVPVLGNDALVECTSILAGTHATLSAIESVRAATALAVIDAQVATTVVQDEGVRAVLGTAAHVDKLFWQVLVAACPSLTPVMRPLVLGMIERGESHLVIDLVRNTPGSASLLPEAMSLALERWQMERTVSRLVLVVTLATLGSQSIPIPWEDMAAMAVEASFPLVIGTSLIRHVLERPVEAPPLLWAEILFHTRLTLGLRRYVSPGRSYEHVLTVLVEYAAMTKTVTTNMGTVLISLLAETSQKTAVRLIHEHFPTSDAHTRLSLLSLMPVSVIGHFADDVRAAVFGRSVSLAILGLSILRLKPVPVGEPEISVTTYTRRLLAYTYGTPTGVVCTLYPVLPDFALRVMACMCEDFDEHYTGIAMKILSMITIRPDQTIPETLTAAMRRSFLVGWYARGDVVALDHARHVVVMGLSDGTYQVVNVARPQEPSVVQFVDMTPTRELPQFYTMRKRWILKSWGDLVRMGYPCPPGCVENIRHMLHCVEGFLGLRQELVDLCAVLYSRGFMTCDTLTSLLTRYEVARLVQDMPRTTPMADELDIAISRLYVVPNARRIMSQRRHDHHSVQTWLLDVIVRGPVMSTLSTAVDRSRMWTTLARYVKKRYDAGDEIRDVSECINLLGLVMASRRITGRAPIPIQARERGFFEILALKILGAPPEELPLMAKRMLVSLYRHNPILATDAVMTTLLPLLERHHVGVVDLVVAILNAPPDRPVTRFLSLACAVSGVKRTRSAAGLQVSKPPVLGPNTAPPPLTPPPPTGRDCEVYFP
jgi:hypothetical protein